MNLFVKKNIVLVSVLAVSGVVALVLLVFIAIASFGLFETFSDIAKVKVDVAALNRKSPAPCPENEERIKKDIEVVDRALAGFSVTFEPPMQSAVNEFIKVLQPPVVAPREGANGLNEEEFQKYRVVHPNESEMDDEAIQKLPKISRKLTLAEFKELYNSRFEKDYGDSPSKNMLSTQELFIDRFSRLFPNWNAALRAFVKAARQLTVEPIAGFNDEAVLLTAMGFPRAVPQPLPFSNHMDEYSKALRKIAGEDEEKFFLAQAVIDFMNKREGNGNTVNLNVADMREMYFHRDVLGNLLTHVVKSGVKAMYDIKARDFADAPEEGRLYGNFVENIGNFKLYHYTIEVSGSLENVRKLCRMLDESYKNKRLYVVRAVTLYAEENGAAVLMGQKQAPKEEANKSEESEVQGRRRRRRQSEDELSESEHEKWKKADEELERAKEPEKRKDYAAVLVGKTPQCRAMIDIDYIIPEQQQ